MVGDTTGKPTALEKAALGYRYANVWKAYLARNHKRVGSASGVGVGGAASAFLGFRGIA